MLQSKDRAAPLILFACVLGLSVFGIVMLYSVTADIFGESYLKKQFQWLAIGVVSAAAWWFSDYRAWAKHGKWVLVAVSVPLFYLAALHILERLGVPRAVIARFPLVKGSINGAYRWLHFGSISVQPSEFAKFAVILYLARFYAVNPRAANSFVRGFVVPSLKVGVVLGAILLGGSLSATVITGSVVMGMLFVAGVRLRYLVIPALAGVLLVAVVLRFNPQRSGRIEAWRDPAAHADDKGYQLWQSMKAMGSGSWTGLGLNQSRMKEFYLPEAHTDFVLSIAGEELGFLAILSVALGYLLMAGAALVIAMRAADRVGLLLGFGIGLSLGLHAFVNLGVVSGFLPTTGIAAPLISYGGSAMVATWAGIGCLLNIARVARRERDGAWDTPADQQLERVGQGLLPGLPPAEDATNA